MLQKVRKIVQEECQKNKRYGSHTWKHHILKVVKYSKLLAKKLGADEELAELAALLHDLGSIKYGEESHEITGQRETEKILKKLNYPQNTIDRVKECIASHRASKDVVPKTVEAKIVANADAMAHFDTVSILLRLGLDKYDHNEEKAAKWVLRKLERDWTKKLTIPQAKEMVVEKYRAAKLLLSSCYSAT